MTISPPYYTILNTNDNNDNDKENGSTHPNGLRLSYGLNK